MKRSLCLILAVMLSLVAISELINISYADGAEGFVHSVHLAMVPFPKAGDQSDDFDYCDIDDDNISLTVYGWEVWNDGHLEMYSGKFEKGKTYYLELILEIQDDRQFVTNLDTGEVYFDDLTFNGRDMTTRIDDTIIDDSEKTLDIWLIIDFDTDWSNIVSELDLRLTNGLPEAGDYAGEFMECESEDGGVYCREMAWFVKQGEDYIQYYDEFEAGKTYYAAFDIRTRDFSLEFEHDDQRKAVLDSVTINGNDMSGNIEDSFYHSPTQIEVLISFYFPVTPGTPEVTGINVYGKGIELSWLAVENADEYLIYRKNGNAFVIIASVTDLSFTDTDVTGGQEYTYFVMARNNTDETYSPGSDDVTVQYNPFKDVKTSASYFKYLMWAYNNGVIMGTSSTTFNPNGDCKRCDLAVMLYRMYGKPSVSGQTIPFTDVKSTDYYYKAVVWAYNQGYIKGTSSTKFNPKGSITRQDMVVILWRMAGSPKVTVENPFTDVDESSYAYKAIMWAYKNKITSGTSSDKFSPKSNCLRYQLAVFLSKFNNIVHVI